MELIQKKFKFQNGDKIIPNSVETEGLKLVINSINTDLSIKDLFVDSKISAGYIKGWSLLALLEDSVQKENFNSLDLKGNKFELSFVGPSGNFYQIYAIEDPTFQYPPKDIEESELDRIIALLQSVQPEETKQPETPKTPETPNTPKPSLEDVVSASSDSVDAGENGAPSNEKAAEAEAEATKEDSANAGESGEAEAEAASEEERAEESEKYAETRFALERLGYVEYVDGNYKLFGHPDKEPYLIVTDGDSVEELGVEEMEIEDEFADYFTSYQDKALVFRFIIATGKLTVLDPKPEEV